MPPTSAAAELAPLSGIQLAYQLHGSGRPLVLLHGGFGSVEMFGPNVAALAAGRQVIGVDLQSHGRTPAIDRPMRFETMADDIAELIRYLGHDEADVMGYSLGGGVALRTAIQHPDRVRRLVLVSAPFRRSAWHAEHVAAFNSMGPHIAEPMKQSPMYEVYRQIAPRVDDWPVLVTQLTTMLREDYDWTDEARRLTMPVMIVVGDADGIPARYAAECFALLGADQRDAVWDRSGMTRHALAVLPRLTHYDIAFAPALATAAATFLDEAEPS